MNKYMIFQRDKLAKSFRCRWCERVPEGDTNTILKRVFRIAPEVMHMPGCAAFACYECAQACAASPRVPSCACGAEAVCRKFAPVEQVLIDGGLGCIAQSMNNSIGSINVDPRVTTNCKNGTDLGTADSMEVHVRKLQHELQCMQGRCEEAVRTIDAVRDENEDLRRDNSRLRKRARKNERAADTHAMMVGAGSLGGGGPWAMIPMI